MRLLLFSNLFPTPAEPARGTFTAQLARHMGASCDVTVVVPLPWFPRGKLARRLMPEYGKAFGDIPPSIDRDGIRVWFARYPLIPKLSEGFHAGFVRMGAQPLIRRLHEANPFDAINAHWLYPDGAAAARIGRALGIPVVITALGSDVNSHLADPAKQRQVLDAAASSQMLTSVSQELRSKLVQYGIPAGKVAVIPNGVDAARFAVRDRAQSRRELGLPGEGKVIVCVARLSPEKGVHVLIEAVATLARSMPDVCLYVLGDGRQRETLEKLRDERACASNVTLVGAVPHESVPLWLGAADISCLPSLSEGHPNALMEALAAGRPVVASRVGAVPEYIRPELGMMVEPSDPAALAAALGTALNTEWNTERISASIRPYTWERTAEEYVRVIREASERMTRGSESFV